MADWIRSDKIQYTVLVDGADVTEYVQLPLRCSYGFDLNTAEATLRFRDIPGTLTNWSTVQIYMGRTGTGTTGNVLRFDGYACDTTFELWPYTLTVPCKGPLAVAEIVEPDVDEELLYQATIDPSKADLLAPGIDMRWEPGTGAEWTDGAMADYVLDKCGLRPKYDPTDGIQGLGRILGALTRDQSFTWQRGQKALQWLQNLDKICLGFRTFDTPTGIKRVQIRPSTPFLANRIDTNEAAHLLEGTTLTVQQAERRNRIVVSGRQWKGKQFCYIASDELTAPPPGVAYITYQFGSPMIEWDEPDGSGYGMTCKEVAEYLLAEHNARMFDATVVTWLDDLFVPGYTAYLNAPHLGGPNWGAWSGEGTMQSMWIRRVDTEISESGAFTQRLGLRGQDYYALAGSASAPATLPLSLKIRGY